jgi:uncharacterized protein YaeQ
MAGEGAFSVALTATIYHFEIDVSDVDRGVYQVHDLRLAQHPSESMRYMLARAIAYCLFYEEGIAFSKGLSTTDEPAVWVKDLQGNVTLWIDVGSPSPERLHKASKAAPRVVVVTQHDPEVLKRQLRGKGIHREGELEIYALAPSFLDAIESKIDRHARWELVRNEGELYVTIGGQSFSGRWERQSVGE